MYFFIELVLWLILIVSVLVGFCVLVYHIARRSIMQVCKMDKDDAEELIATWLSKRKKYELSADVNFWNEVSETVHAIVGDESYENLIKLARSTQLIQFLESDCSYVSVVVPYRDENEKVRAEHLLKKVLVKFLSDHGQLSQVIVKWSVHQELRLPYITLCYAKNNKEREYISHVMERENREIVQRYQPVVDEDDLQDE